MTYVKIVICVFLATGCRVKPTSRSKDIFSQDMSQNGNDRRRPANKDEIYWTISMGGCTGHLISPDTMMSAAHCSPRAGAKYKSGSAIVEKSSADITVEKVMELDRSLDYSVMKIKWNGTKPPLQKFPPLIAHTREALNLPGSGTAKDNGDLLFTVGFPADKSSTWGPTYAQGFPREISGANLRYNIGIINGNSGGGVWRKSDGMLVSLTNGGPNAFGQGNWQGADAEDSSHWNHGVAMWNVYKASAVIKDIFPEGRNRFATVEENKPSNLFAAIDPSSSGSDSKVVLLISTMAPSSRILVCQTQESCGGSDAISTEKDKMVGDRTIYRTKEPLTISSGSTWFIVETDDASKVLQRRTIKFKSK